MELCTLKFALPMNLALPTNTTFRFQFQGTKYAVLAEAQSGVKFHSLRRDSIDWITSPQRAQISHDKSIDPSAVEHFSYIVEGAEQGGVRGGFVDEIEYTILNVIFENPNDDSFENAGLHVEKARPVVKHFIDVCRLLTRRPGVGEFLSVDAPVLVVARSRGHVLDDDLATIPYECAGTSIFDIRHSSHSGRGLPNLDAEQIEALRTHLAAGFVVSIHDSLLMDAVAQHRVGSFDTAIVVLGTGFEVFLQTILRKACAEKNRRDLRFRGSLVPYQEAIERGNIQQDLLRYAQGLIKEFHPGSTYSITDSTQYTNWKKHAYELRNSIVHRGFRGSTHADSRKAFESTEIFRDSLLMLLPVRLN